MKTTIVTASDVHRWSHLRCKWSRERAQLSHVVAGTATWNLRAYVVWHSAWSCYAAFMFCWKHITASMYWAVLQVFVLPQTDGNEQEEEFEILFQQGGDSRPLQSVRNTRTSDLPCSGLKQANLRPDPHEFRTSHHWSFFFRDLWKILYTQRRFEIYIACERELTHM
jgi:hypothetical protein